MTETNKGAEAIIREWQRRLQKLQEKQARLGTNTPAEVLTEIEDIEGKIKELEEVQKFDDPFLALILAISVVTTNNVAITLTVNGVVVSGYLIGAKQFEESLLNKLVTVVEGGKLGVNPELVDRSDKTYIHLQDAHLYPTNGRPIPPLNEPGIYWRGKLSAVDSYAVRVINQ